MPSEKAMQLAKQFRFEVDATIFEVATILDTALAEARDEGRDEAKKLVDLLEQSLSMRCGLYNRPAVEGSLIADARLFVGKEWMVIKPDEATKDSYELDTFNNGSALKSTAKEKPE